MIFPLCVRSPMTFKSHNTFIQYVYMHTILSLLTVLQLMKKHSLHDTSMKHRTRESKLTLFMPISI